MQEWVDILKTFGPSVAFMAFTVWRDFRREERMGHTLDEQGKEITSITKQSITAIEQNTASNKMLTQAIERLPCRVPEKFSLHHAAGE